MFLQNGRRHLWLRRNRQENAATLRIRGLDPIRQQFQVPEVRSRDLVQRCLVLAQHVQRVRCELMDIKNAACDLALKSDQYGVGDSAVRSFGRHVLQLQGAATVAGREALKRKTFHLAAKGLAWPHPACCLRQAAIHEHSY